MVSQGNKWKIDLPGGGFIQKPGSQSAPVVNDDFDSPEVNREPRFPIAIIGIRNKVVQYTGIIRSLTNYITKCLLDTKYKQNPDHTVLNEVIRLNGTQNDTL